MMTRKTTTYAILAALAAFALSLAGACAAQPNGRHIIRKMIYAEGTVAYIGHETTTLHFGGQTLTSEQNIYRAGTRGARMEYTAPSALAGEVLVDDGQKHTHYIPKKNGAWVRPSMLNAMQRRTIMTLDAVDRGAMVVEVHGQETIAGRATWEISIRPTAFGKGHIRRIWVDARKFVPLKSESADPDGKVTSSSCFTKIKYVNAIPAGKFKVVTPPGVHVFEEKAPKPMTVAQAQQFAGFRIMTPGYLPTGFRSVYVMVHPFRGRSMVDMRYTDGVESFSIFESPQGTVSRKFNRRLQGGPQRPASGVYSWQSGDLNLTIVGKLPSSEMRKIADSMK